MNQLLLKILANHKNKTEKNPEGSAHWRMVLLSKKISLPFIPVTGMVIDNRSVDKILYCTKSNFLTVQLMSPAFAFNNLEDIKAEFQGWEISE